MRIQVTEEASSKHDPSNIGVGFEFLGAISPVVDFQRCNLFYSILFIIHSKSFLKLKYSDLTSKMAAGKGDGGVVRPRLAGSDSGGRESDQRCRTKSRQPFLCRLAKFQCRRFHTNNSVIVFVLSKNFLNI